MLLFITMINYTMPRTVTLDGAYRGAALPSSCDLFHWAVAQQQQWRRLFVRKATVAAYSIMYPVS